MLGYTEEEVINMIDCINIAYEIVDVPEWVDKGLSKSIDLLTKLILEGRK
jgi:hypothetical protein